MLDVQGDWIIDSQTARAMKVATEALQSGKCFTEKDYINVITFREIQHIIDIANGNGLKIRKDDKELEKDFEKRLKEKDKIIEQLHRTIDCQLKLIEVSSISVLTIKNDNEIIE